MKKRWLAIALALALTLTLVLAPVQLVAAAGLGTDIDGTKVTIDNCRLTEGNAHGWEGMDASMVTYEGDAMIVTPAAGTKSMYYRPNSPYGQYGAFGEGGVTMKLKLDFADGATDWGAQLLIRNTGSMPSWGATNAVYMLFYSNKIALYRAGIAEPLAVLNKGIGGAWHNIEFITDDLDDGTTSVYVLITDENGNLVQNDGDTSQYTMKADGIPTESLPAAFITFVHNGASLSSYSMKSGEWTFNKTTEPEVTEPEVTEPEVTEPEVTEPEATEPEVTEPEEEYPSLEGVTCYDFEHLGISTNGEGLDRYWAPVGAPVKFQKNAAGNLITVTEFGINGLYYGPCSPHGGDTQANVALAMTLGIDFLPNAGDFGLMLIIKAEETAPSWSQPRGLALMFYPNYTNLCVIMDQVPIKVASYNNKLQPGVNYNLEFIAIDNEDGTTNAYVKITDENGNALHNNGETGEFTMKALNIEYAGGEGYITMFGNQSCITEYRFGTGKFSVDVETSPDLDEDPKPTDPSDPTDPSEPMQPDPTDPSEPTQPEPVDPTNPTEPVDPTNPTEPADPTQPTDPGKLPQTGDQLRKSLLWATALFLISILGTTAVLFTKKRWK